MATSVTLSSPSPPLEMLFSPTSVLPAYSSPPRLGLSPFRRSKPRSARVVMNVAVSTEKISSDALFADYKASCAFMFPGQVEFCNSLSVPFLTYFSANVSTFCFFCHLLFCEKQCYRELKQLVWGKMQRKSLLPWNCSAKQTISLGEFIESVLNHMIYMHACAYSSPI